MDPGERAEQWSKVLVLLEGVKADQENLVEIRRILGRLMADLESSNDNTFPRTVSPYKQQSLAIRLQSAIDGLNEGTERLNDMGVDIRTMCKKFYVMEKIHAQVRANSSRMLQRMQKLRDLSMIRDSSEVVDEYKKILAPANEIAYGDIVKPLKNSSR